MENMDMHTDRSIKTTVAIAGGGPAGMMLGLLLARANVDVTVIEKYSDFLRDFRGDTIHPSTLDIIDQLGFIREFLALPHAGRKVACGNRGSESHDCRFLVVAG